MKNKSKSMKSKAAQSARLGAYLAAGVGASVAATGEADAAIVYFEVDPAQTISTGNPRGVVFGNINLGAGTYTLNSYPVAPYFGFYMYNLVDVPLSSNGIQFASQAYGATARFDSGDQIDSAFSWGAVAIVAPYWSAGSSGYLGLRMDAGASQHYYGWAAISFNNPGNQMTISGFAFENDANTAFTAGAIPEPGAFALLALAAGGGAFLRWRRRRDEARKEAA